VITTNYKTVGKSLLAHLLEVLMGWMCSSQQAMALSGVYLLREMVEQIAGSLDEEGWSIVVGRLRCAWNMCASHGKSSEGGECPPFVSWIDGDHALNVSVIRIRCQVLIALQRVVHEIHDTLSDKMPTNLIPKAIEILLTTVKQTAEVNSDQSFMKRFSKYLHESDRHTATQSFDGTPEMSFHEEQQTLPVSIQEETPPEETEVEDKPARVLKTQQSEIKTEEEARAEEEAAAAAELPNLMTQFSQNLPPIITKTTMAAEEDSHRDTLPELCTKLSTHGDSVFSGFLRINVEGGMLTIDALLKRHEAENGTTEVTEQLLNFCRSLIIEASAETRTLVERARDGGEMDPLQSQWEQAVKAPLIARALEAYKSIEGDVLANELKELVPHLSMLICNPQASIRQAISDFMKTKTSAVLKLNVDVVVE